MDPVLTALIGAFVVGATKGSATVGEKAIADAYHAFKNLLTRTCGEAANLWHAVSDLQKKPANQPCRDAVAKELEAAGALDNDQLVRSAEAVIEAAEKAAGPIAIGVDLGEVKAARIKIQGIRARAGSIGFRAARLESMGEIEFGAIDVGGNSGK